MILVDSSTWIDFFRTVSTAKGLPLLLEGGEIACHPWIRGELMLGSLGQHRFMVLSALIRLPQCQTHSIDDLADFVEREKLFGSGLSLIDIQLLYCCLVENHFLWTHDKRLYRVSKRFGVAFSAQ